MTFKKQFPQESFLSVLSHEWQKTSEIAKKVGCGNKLVTTTLLEIPEVEWHWVKGGKVGTREWRLKELK